MMHVGSSGRDVARLKSRLRRLHYAVDSGQTFTAATHHAVMAFQKINGLQRDGVVGAQTLSALRKPRLPRLPASGSTRVIVDLSDQVLILARGGRARLIVNASTGNPLLPDGRGEATPVGSFRVGTKIAGPHRAELGTLWWPSFFHGGIAVHGAPSIPATRASHGCVRIPMHLARPIFDAMHAGMLVQVRR